jgi:hypothetical protein
MYLPMIVLNGFETYLTDFMTAEYKRIGIDTLHSTVIRKAEAVVGIRFILLPLSSHGATSCLTTFARL